jgi:hypothetical protein
MESLEPPYTFEAHVNGEQAGAGKAYTIEAHKVTADTVPTFEGGTSEAGYRYQLPDGTPVEKIGVLAFELPDGAVLVTTDLNAP